MGEGALSLAMQHQFTGQEQEIAVGYAPVKELEDGPGFRALHPRVTMSLLLSQHYCNPITVFRLAPYKLRSLGIEEMLYVCIRAKAGMRRDSGGRPVMELVFLTLTGDEFFEDPQIAEEWNL